MTTEDRLKVLEGFIRTIPEIQAALREPFTPFTCMDTKGTKGRLPLPYWDNEVRTRLHTMLGESQLSLEQIISHLNSQ
jgi:hypothetical protein